MGVETYDLSSSDGCRACLAAETLAFLIAGKDGDVNRFRAVVAALGELMAADSRKAEHELEGDIATLTQRLDEWERTAGNVQ